MKLPELHIDDLVAKLPIIQGGMSIRISSGRLAGAVAATGAIGVIGASGLAFDELKNEIRQARELAKGGIFGINIMYAAREFLGIVHTAIKENIHFITTGAGFSRDIYKIGKEARIPILPIVSSAKLALLGRQLGASAIVVESSEAGGHLGTLTKNTETLLKEVKEVVTDLPVIAAGGLVNGKDICRIFKLGADGVQLSTRFVLTEECNAAPEYKEVYLKSKPEDVAIITSPVGLPGRALKTKFVEKILSRQAPKPVGCDYCLKKCSLEYCIVQALINAQKGDVDNGVVFCGANVYKIPKKIVPAAEIVRELVEEAEECLSLSS